MPTLTPSIIISRNPFNHPLTRYEQSRMPAALRHHAIVLTPNDTQLLATSTRPDQLARIALDAGSCWGVPVIGWCRCWACSQLIDLKVIRPIQPATPPQQPSESQAVLLREIAELDDTAPSTWSARRRRMPQRVNDLQTAGWITRPSGGWWRLTDAGRQVLEVLNGQVTR